MRSYDTDSSQTRTSLRSPAGLRFCFLAFTAAVSGGCGYALPPEHARPDTLRTENPSIHVDRGRSRAVLLLHGFSASPADFGGLPRALDRAGWDVHVPWLPGHGTSPDELAAVSASRIREAAEDHYTDLCGRYETVVLGGFSMGGCLATGLAADEPPAALVLVSPFYAITYRWYYILPVEWWQTVASLFLDSVPPGKHVNRPGAEENIVTYDRIPLAALDMLYALRDRVMEGLAERQLGCPVLLLQSAADSVASPDRAREVIGRFTAGNYCHRRFTRSDHYILHDYDRREAVRSAVEFLGDHAGTAE